MQGASTFRLSTCREPSDRLDTRHSTAAPSSQPSTTRQASSSLCAFVGNPRGHQQRTLLPPYTHTDSVQCCCPPTHTHARARAHYFDRGLLKMHRHSILSSFADVCSYDDAVQFMKGQCLDPAFSTRAPSYRMTTRRSGKCSAPSILGKLNLILLHMFVCLLHRSVYTGPT